METVLAECEGQATLRLIFAGEGLERHGANIYQLGQSLISSQELVNVTASHKIRGDIPIDRYLSTPVADSRPRAYFLQGHLAATKRGSLDLLVQFVAQPELRKFLLDPDVRSFGVSVLANLATHAAVVLTGRWREANARTAHSAPNRLDPSLTAELVPQLEKLSRRVTRRSGVESIELITEDADGNRLEFRVNGQSLDHVLDYAQSAPPSAVELVGEIRQVDLDSKRAILVHEVTGERMQLETLDHIGPLSKLLGSRVHVWGVVRSLVNSRRQISTMIEVERLERLPSMQWNPIDRTPP